MPRQANPLTAKAVDALAARASKYYVRDQVEPHLELAVYPSGRKVWQFTWARKKRAPIADADELTLARARVVAGERWEAFEELQRNPGLALTLGAYISAEYWRHAAATLSRGGKVADLLLRKDGDGWAGAFASLGDISMAKLCPMDFERWRRDRLAKGNQPGTVNRLLAQLRAALNIAERDGLLTSGNPIAELKMLKQPEGVVRFLSDAETARLERVMANRPGSHHIVPIVEVSRWAGLRRGEIFALTWGDIGAESIAVRGETAKSKRTRHVPIHPALRDVLERWRPYCPPSDEGLVFPSDTGGRLDTIKRSWATLMKDAEIDGFRFHDLRHDFASRMVQRGVSMSVIQALLGHESSKMTERYAHLADENLRAGIAAL